MGIGKPSTVQKSLTELFSYTVCDLSLTRKCGPLIIGPSYTYLSSLFFFIYPDSVRINLFEWHKKKSLLDRCEFGYEGKSRGSYHFLHMDVCFVLISLLHRLWAKDKKKKSDLQSRFSVYIHDMPRSSFICSIYLKCGRIVSNYYLKKKLK